MKDPKDRNESVLQAEEMLVPDGRPGVSLCYS